MENALPTPRPYWPARHPSDAPAERPTNQETPRESGRTFPRTEAIASARSLALLASTLQASNIISKY